MATKDGVTSVAFPAVGTGYLQFPHALVAQAMFEEVKSFSRASAGTTITSILFVVYDSDKETLDVSSVVMQCDRFISFDCFK